ncbi:MAG: ABC transporter permease [Lachnospiraceae bacterium]|nr:ABC transporter permease [Lachnospiraceae bacterium]
MTILIQYTLVYASILSLVALGGCFSEHSGVINLGLEGTMVIGALGGALTMNAIEGSLPGLIVVLIALISAALSGLVYTMLLAVAAIHFNADQTLVGTAMNMLGVAFATVVVKAINLSHDSSNVSAAVKYRTAQSYFVIKIGSMRLSWFMIIAFAAVIISFVVLYKTKFGLRLMACGEHPQAADSVGINVYKMRWAGVLISGVLGGLGGLTYIAINNGECEFNTGVCGYGFLALAVMIFGKWKPQNIFLASLLFGFFRALSSVYMGIGWLNNMHIPNAVYIMLPYIISLIVLALTSKNSAAPKAEGIPYDKGAR